MSAKIFCAPRAHRRRAMREIAKARASHTLYALPLACGAAQPSPPHLSQGGRGRSGRQPLVQSTCRHRQNVSARTCERTRDTARFIAKAACSHRVHVRLLARAPAPSSPLQPGWGTCEARRLTSALTHAHMHHNKRSNHALHTLLHSLRELDSHLRPSQPSDAAREGRGRRGDVIEGCRDAW